MQFSHHLEIVEARKQKTFARIRLSIPSVYQLHNLFIQIAFAILGLAVALSSHASKAQNSTDSSVWSDLPFYLNFDKTLCPDWVSPDQPRAEYLMESHEFRPPHRYFGHDGPYRLEAKAQIWVGNEPYRIPLGYIGRFGFQEREVDTAMSENGPWQVSKSVPFFAFWAPSLRFTERTFRPHHPRFCEPGRPYPSLGEHVVAVKWIPLPGSSFMAERREFRTTIIENYEKRYNHKIQDILHGKVDELKFRLTNEIPGAISISELSHAPESDLLQRNSFLVQGEGISGLIRCIHPLVAAAAGRPEARFLYCKLFIGPIAQDSALPELEFNLSRDKLKLWSDTYMTIVNLLTTWNQGGHDYVGSKRK